MFLRLYTLTSISLSLVVFFCLNLFILGVKGRNPQLLKFSNIKEELHFGSWGEIMSAQSLTESYYICGGEMNSFSYKILQEPRYCKRSIAIRGPGYQGSCKKKKVFIWMRTNQIKFRFCHLSQWTNQMNKGNTSSKWPWQGMKMCPAGEYVYGFQTKMDQNNGLNGLLLYCQTLSGSTKSTVIVKDGIGEWHNIYQGNINQFAYQFQLKIGEMLTGLDFGLSAR